MENIEFKKIKKPRFSKGFRYSTCWEDPYVIQKALQIDSRDTVLCISSAGCNVLNFLLYDPREILAVDYSPRQNSLLKLKIEAIRNLTYEEFIELMGIFPSDKKIDIYLSLRKNLDDDTRKFWDYNLYFIKKGIVYNGLEEKRLKTIGNILKFFIGKEKIENLFGLEKIEEQCRFFYDYVDGNIANQLIKLLYSRAFTILRLSYGMFVFSIFPLTGIKRTRDEVQIDFQLAKNLFSQEKFVEELFTTTPLNDNYFASLMLLGYYTGGDCLPPYLKKEAFITLKKRVDNIKIETSSIQNILQRLPDNTITKFSLSNIFDWVSNIDFMQQLNDISRVGKNQARFCYFSTRIDRNIPDNVMEIQLQKQLAFQLIKDDKTHLYSDLEIGKIIK